MLNVGKIEEGFVLDHIKAETEAGRPISYQEDGRVQFKGERRRR